MTDNKIKQKISEPDISFRQFVLNIYRIYQPLKKSVFLVFSIMALMEAVALVNPYVYGRIIDAIVSGKPMASVVILLLISLAVALVNNLFGYIRERIEIKKLDFEITRYVAAKTLQKIMEFSIGQHENQNSGIKKSIIDRGQHSLETLMYTFVYDIAPVILRVVIVITALFILAPILGAMVFTAFFILIGITIYLNIHFRSGLKEIQDEHHEINKKHAEILCNVSLVKTNAKENEVVDEYDSAMRKLGVFVMRFWTRFISWVMLRTVFLHISRFSVMLVGVYLVYKKIYTPGFLLTFWSWSNNAFYDFGRLSGVHRRVMDLYAAIKKYFILLDVETDVKEIENSVKPEKFLGKIEFKNIYFKYPKREYIKDEKEKPKIVQSKKRIGEEYVLKNINLTIASGQKVAIVGPSGVGKTSLAQLIIRAYDPNKGQILIDGNDLKNLDLANFRSHIGSVSQDIALFDNTLRYNIVFGVGDKQSVSEEQLSQAAKMACIDKFIAKLEEGYNTIIGERGIKLSGGERQRVGIARALVKNPSILIFDEATSSLDTENEALIRRSIEKASRGRTTIIIAHRLSTIKDADKIIVMDGGRIVGEGKHEELLATCKTYQRLINNQTVMVGGA